MQSYTVSVELYFAQPKLRDQLKNVDAEKQLGCVGAWKRESQHTERLTRSRTKGGDALKILPEASPEEEEYFGRIAPFLQQSANSGLVADQLICDISLAVCLLVENDDGTVQPVCKSARSVPFRDRHDLPGSDCRVSSEGKSKLPGASRYIDEKNSLVRSPSLSSEHRDHG